MCLLTSSLYNKATVSIGARNVLIQTCLLRSALHILQCCTHSSLCINVQGNVNQLVHPMRQESSDQHVCQTLSAVSTTRLKTASAAVRFRATQLIDSGIQLLGLLVCLSQCCSMSCKHPSVSLHQYSPMERHLWSVVCMGLVSVLRCLVCMGLVTVLRCLGRLYASAISQPKHISCVRRHRTPINSIGTAWTYLLPQTAQRVSEWHRHLGHLLVKLGSTALVQHSP